MTTYGLEEDIGQNHYDVTSCQFYDKECVTKIIIEPNNANQVERTKLNEIKEKSESTLDSKLDLVEYINECSTEQQQILSTDNRKNQKLVIIPIKSKIDNVTESRLVIFEKKENYQQIETSKFKITTFR